MIIDTSQYKVNDIIDKVDFKELVEIEYYHATNPKEKQKALNIIKNNDFLQYHYFAQDYRVVKGASVLALMSIKYNNIKMYIGFASLNSLALNKTLRGRYYGSRLIEYSYFRPEKLNSYVISRVVLLPSYRGLGLAKFFVNNIAKYIKKQPDFFYLEIISNMFHNYYFAGDEFNSFFVDIKNTLSKENYDKYFASYMYDEDGNIRGGGDRLKFVVGVKGITKLIGNVAFIYNEKYNYILEEWYKGLYDIDIDFSINKTLTEEEILKCNECNFPLFIAMHSNEEIRELTPNKEFKEQYT